MATYSDAFGGEVRRVLEESKHSDREIARRSRGAISHYTIGQMRTGFVPNSDLIVAFAEAVGKSPPERVELANQLLKLANKRVLYPSVRSWAGPEGALVGV